MRNYRRFYGLLKRLPGADKETLVLQYTRGRTRHLHETSRREYDSMCGDMEKAAGRDARREDLKQELRKRRSVALHRMQKAGVDTADWARVDNLCMNPRIAGKPFRRLDAGELTALATKMRLIERKGGLKKRGVELEPVTTGATGHYMVIDFSKLMN